MLNSNINWQRQLIASLSYLLSNRKEKEKIFPKEIKYGMEYICTVTVVLV